MTIALIASLVFNVLLVWRLYNRRCYYRENLASMEVYYRQGSDNPPPQIFK